jgi:hypothetical protein
MAVVAWLEVLQKLNVPGWAALPNRGREVLVYKFSLGGSEEPRTDDDVARRFNVGKRQHAGRQIRDSLLKLLISDRANHEAWPMLWQSCLRQRCPRTRSALAGSGDQRSSGGKAEAVWVSAVFLKMFGLA